MQPLRTEISFEFTFQAAHTLPWHSGKCRNMHGHSYRCELFFAGQLTDEGIVVDFDAVDSFVAGELMPVLDHTYLNDSMPNPTAELIAARIFLIADAAGLPISGVRLWETATSSAIVRPTP
ncbi:6-pyruvoyl tetrahydropterin synthase/QueD family protein [Leifsonia aquatica ATCC 14665]|nr:6-pyruvoyl tetrahydropterin synthase/QueD family protein [Leifsonia aquatica ATCC 14665]